MLRSTLLKLSESKGFANWVTSNGTTRRMARRFVAGETLDEAIAAARECHIETARPSPALPAAFPGADILISVGGCGDIKKYTRPNTREQNRRGNCKLRYSHEKIPYW